VTNHKARRDYHILETFERASCCTATEVKSLRRRQGADRRRLRAVETTKSALQRTHWTNTRTAISKITSPRRRANCCLHRSESGSCFELASVKGHALVPLAFFWKNGKVKVALGVGKGKREFGPARGF